MNNKKFLEMSLILSLTACAMAPNKPEVELRPANTYISLNCRQLRDELHAVQTWQKYYTDDLAYQKSSSDSFDTINVFGALLTGLATAMGDSSSVGQLSQLSNTGTTESTAAATNAQNAQMYLNDLSSKESGLQQIIRINECA